ncbi:MAG: phage portal protein [Hyphomicrobiaceae bacterium]
MLETIQLLIKKDTDLPLRAWRIGMLEEFRTSKVYDRIKIPFHTEKEGDGTYVPIRKRRPSVRYGLPMIIVNDSTSLLFSESHFPAIQLKERTALRTLKLSGEASDVETKADDDNKSKGRKRPAKKKASAALQEKNEDIATLINNLIKEARLRAIMLDAATRGSVGSVAIHFRLLKSRVFFKVLSTQYLTPSYDPEEPDKLVSVVERYKIKGAQVAAMGYSVKKDDLSADYWFQRSWTKTQELWFVPWKVSDTPPQVPPTNYVPKGTVSQSPVAMDTPVLEGGADARRSVNHGLGFVPVEWIRNLPGGDETDGAATFEPALENSVEMDYQLSQSGRGLKYMSDPTLVISEPPITPMGNSSEPMIKSAANALRVPEGASAHLLEISGAGAAAVENYVRTVREFSLELCGGNRSSADKLSAAQSGRAMELMNQGLIWLADKMRTSYGEVGLINLIRMVVRANESFPLNILGQTVPKGFFGAADSIEITLKWPPWYAPTLQDHMNQASAIRTYRQADVLSQDTAVRQIAHDFDIEDPEDEIEQIRSEKDDAMKRQVEMEKQTRPFEYKPSGQKPEA